MRRTELGLETEKSQAERIRSANGESTLPRAKKAFLRYQEAILRQQHKTSYMHSW